MNGSVLPYLQNTVKPLILQAITTVKQVHHSHQAVCQWVKSLHICLVAHIFLLPTVYHTFSLFLMPSVTQVSHIDLDYPVGC